jgi:hypothetical protein
MPYGFYCDGCNNTTELSNQIERVSKKYMRAKAVCAVLATLLCFSLAANITFTYIS